MATVNETISPLGHYVKEGQAIGPNYLTGSFAGDDADDHIFKVDGRGKGRMTVAVHNATDKTATVTVYGMHVATGAIGDVGTFEIGLPGGGSFTVLAADDWGYQVINDPFPFYLVKITLGASPDGSTVNLRVNFSAF